MKAMTAYLLAAIIFGLVGTVCLLAGMLDRDMARAQERVVAADYAQLEEVLDTAERYSAYASLVPWVGNGPLNDIRARKAAMQYWQRHYAAVAPAQPDPLGNVAPTNIELQFLVANALYRQGVSLAGNRAARIAALETSIAAYLTVLKNATRHSDAAHNYEYLVRVHDEARRGKTAPSPQTDGPHGRAGTVQARPNTREFKVYVPLESKERQKDDAGQAGKAAPLKRKG
jgi:hypothetical protein